ncbi:hypothetical protein PR048_014449 [Dryococelus australis]|uniref:CHK kinase-like domain-containing protein n=1 Tax=Dryococelus australis TaxID=614101 RepID=A0ABQ9HEH5_9NEOP|nr:hypothetical protein PR048_014449 [Dryococelus australis]
MALEVMQSLPNWLTEDYIADLLCKRQKSDLQVKIRDVTNASGQGDNYLGSVYRITVECNSLHKSLIVKVMPSENEGSEFISSFGVFERELEMYNNILPNLYRVMEEKLGKIEYFSPYCYPSTRSDTIILEDLKTFGYKMADRKEQLDMDHALLVLTVLAKLHSFSYIMGPESIRHYYDIFFSQERRHLSGGYLTSIFKSLCRAVSKWKGYEKYTSSLWRFSESAVEQYNEAVRAREGSFCVLTHGDCWTTNIMFRYCPETGKVQDVKLIDYQLGRYSTPALDLTFFFYTSIKLDVWRQQDKLLRHYHNELVRWLSLAGVDASVYSLQDLQIEMKEKTMYALGIISTVTAIALGNPGDGPDLAKLLHENSDTPISEYHKLHSANKYRKNVQEFLAYFKRDGLFNF